MTFLSDVDKRKTAESLVQHSKSISNAKTQIQSEFTHINNIIDKMMDNPHLYTVDEISEAKQLGNSLLNGLKTTLNSFPEY